MLWQQEEGRIELSVCALDRAAPAPKTAQKWHQHKGAAGKAAPELFLFLTDQALQNPCKTREGSLIVQIHQRRLKAGFSESFNTKLPWSSVEFNT